MKKYKYINQIYLHYRMTDTNSIDFDEPSITIKTEYIYKNTERDLTTAFVIAGAFLGFTVIVAVILLTLFFVL